MSTRHPTPWTIQLGDNGKRGKARAKWADIIDANGVFVTQGLDESTAKEVVSATNGPQPCRCGTPARPVVGYGYPADGTVTRRVLCVQCGRRGEDAQTAAGAVAAWNKEAAQ